MKKDVRWVTSPERYQTAVRLHKEFPTTELWTICLAIDRCGGDEEKVREYLAKEAK